MERNASTRTPVREVLNALRKGELVREIDLPLPRLNSGKVREVFIWEKNSLFIVSTDRISTFDYVHPGGVPGKGIILNQMSNFWFGHTKYIFPNHIITENFSGLVVTSKVTNSLVGRSVVVTRTEPFKAECIVRGYLT